ncbi:hypothetical protein GQ44DRAFT_683863 [Phaeosphaeriaceae sp. PMI808]|nr:hypothetical protein GQ44DRAFT_683863 [Phaeosphaeriaceae sp. PMI808]
MSSFTRSPSRSLAPQSTGDTPFNVRDAALRGASLAFSKPPVKPKPQANTYTGRENGALLAATKVGTDWTGGSSRGSSRPNFSPMQVNSKSNSPSTSMSTLGVSEHHLDRGPSPSNIAAKLAAARHSPLRPKSQAVAPVMSERHANEKDILPPSGSVGSVLARLETKKPSQQPHMRRDSLGSQTTASSIWVPQQSDKPTDDTSIPATASLVEMFEQNRSTTPTNLAAVPKSMTQSSPPPIRSPKPQRAIKLPPAPEQDYAPITRQKTHTPPPVKPKPKHRIELPRPQFTNNAPYFQTPQKDPMKSPPIKQKPVQLAALNTNASSPPLPPSQRGSRQVRPVSEDIGRSTSIRRTMSISAGSENIPSSPASFKQITKHMTGESLSSAIMGAALASSRNASPAPSQPIPNESLFPPRKHHHHHSPFHRSPSPQKQSPPKSAGKLRTTMRKDPPSSEDEGDVDKYKKNGTRIMGIKGRKHPNKHHEGTRRRWRDQITERERKRYEGVWAANKGLYLPAISSSLEDDPSQDVLSFAAQEIWLRSRLPIDVLEEVWDLVDSRAIGQLKRDEFVVGLWLIDQRLKGRKLPVKVSQSVWTSARGVGIKVKVKR